MKGVGGELEREEIYFSHVVEPLELLKEAIKVEISGTRKIN